MEYVSGDDVTDNKYLAEAIDLTREGSAQLGATDYDQGENPTLRDSTFYSVIEELQKVDSAPAKEQEKIDGVIQNLQNAQNAPNDRRARAMAEAHDTLQDVWAPPE